MIDRYVTKEMNSIWSEESKFRAYLAVEIANVEALHEQGVVTTEELRRIQKNATFHIARIHEIEQQTKHDVIAFTRAVSESLGPEKRFIHYGLTSTDVVDTANGLLIKQANQLIQARLETFMQILKKKAIQYQDTICIGRTHGIHADITVFGLKYALWYSEMSRNLRRFKDARIDIEVGKCSGAVGNYAFISPKIEARIMQLLDLKAVDISTQTLQRDRHAYYLSTLALIAATLEKIATEIRHLMRTEVGEVSEYFDSTQKGSSAMPHKKNPISSENICGLARMVRSYVTPSFENIALWHERDISHSSVERIVFPDATSLVDYMLDRYSKTMDQLIVYEENMLANIQKTYGVIFSQRVLTKLIDLGHSRETAYDRIQALSYKAYQEKKDFAFVLAEDEWVSQHLTKAQIQDCFTTDFYKREVPTIFARVFKD